MVIWKVPTNPLDPFVKDRSCTPLMIESNTLILSSYSISFTTSGSSWKSAGYSGSAGGGVFMIPVPLHLCIDVLSSCPPHLQQNSQEHREQVIWLNNISTTERILNMIDLLAAPILLDSHFALRTAHRMLSLPTFRFPVMGPIMESTYGTRFTDEITPQLSAVTCRGNVSSLGTTSKAHSVFIGACNGGWNDKNVMHVVTSCGFDQHLVAGWLQTVP